MTLMLTCDEFLAGLQLIDSLLRDGGALVDLLALSVVILDHFHPFLSWKPVTCQ